MKKKPIGLYVLIFVAIFVVALIVMGIMVKIRIDAITRESNKIAVMDIENETVDSTIYTSGKYAVVESAVKNYIGSYLEELDKLDMIRNDATLAAMLGIDNLYADGPEFSTSREYIEKVRGRIENVRTNLKAMSKEDAVLERFNNKGLNFFFNWLYKKQMLEVITLNFFYSDEAVDQMADALNSSLDAKEAVLNFLTENSTGWTIEDGMLQFENDELLARYQELTAAV